MSVFDLMCIVHDSILRTDKFALISVVWDKFVNNCIVCYKLGENTTVDKQLFPTKVRCRFTQYMANKPDKFGIKLWLAVDMESKYLLNAIPYLGKDETRPSNQIPSESVIMKIVDQLLGKAKMSQPTTFLPLFMLVRRSGKKILLVGTLKKIQRKIRRW